MAHLTAELSRRDAEIEHLKLVLAKLRRMQFGHSSEKLDQQIEQLELQLEDLEAEEAVAEAKAPAEVAPRKRAERKPLPPHLPREERVHSPASDACPDCGGNLKYLGEDVSEQLEYVPASSASSATCVPRWHVPAATRSCRCRQQVVLSNAALLPLDCWPMCWYQSMPTTCRSTAKA